MQRKIVLWQCQSGMQIFFSHVRYFQDRRPFNILFFGTDSFALETLGALHLNRSGTFSTRVVDKLHVVSTSPESVVAKFAGEHDLELLSWPLQAHSLDIYNLGVLVSFGRMVPRKVILQFPHGILNVHPSLLPRWRGASPIIHTVLNDDRETGISIMSIQAAQGPIVKQTKLAVPEDCTAASLADMLAREGAHLLLKTLGEMPDILQKAEPQDETGITYAHKADAAMATVNWEEQTSRQIKQQFRALSHKFPLRSTWMDQPVKLMDMVLDTDDRFEPQFSQVFQRQTADNSKPGSVVFDMSLQAVCIKCLDSWVAFRSVTLKKSMSALDFHNGYLSKDKHKDMCLQSHHNGLFGFDYWQMVLQPKVKKS